MEIITNIFTASVKARIGGCDNRGVIAETESGKTYCLSCQGAAHGFQKIAKGFKECFGHDISNFEEAFEVVAKKSRKGRVYYEALESQY